MTIEATALVFKAEVRPKEKLVLIWVAEAGDVGMARDPQSIGHCANFVNANPKRVQKAINRLLKSRHLELTPFVGDAGRRVRVNVENPP